MKSFQLLATSAVAFIMPPAFKVQEKRISLAQVEMKATPSFNFNTQLLNDENVMSYSNELEKLMNEMEVLPKDVEVDK